MFFPLRSPVSWSRGIVGVLGLTVLFGCGDRSSPTGAGAVGDVESSRWNPSAANALATTLRPAGPVRALRSAYETRDLGLFAQLFDPDHFTFVFDPLDVLEDPTVPPSWEWADERAVTERLFADDRVRVIRLDYQVGPAAPVEPTDGVPLDWYKVRVTDVDLLIEVREPGDDESFYFLVQGDQALFFVRRTEGSRLPEWKIVEWRDIRTIGVVEQESWGTIKTYWR